jgi:hypothetical protein
MNDSVLFAVYWLSVPLVLAGLGWLAVWWTKREDEREHPPGE